MFDFMTTERAMERVLKEAKEIKVEDLQMAQTEVLQIIQHVTTDDMIEDRQNPDELDWDRAEQTDYIMAETEIGNACIAYKYRIFNDGENEYIINVIEDDEGFPWTSGDLAVLFIELQELEAKKARHAEAVKRLLGCFEKFINEAERSDA